MVKKRLFLAMVIMLIMGVMAAPGIITAKGNPELDGPVKLDEPLSFRHPEYLSGQAWLSATGQDPSLGFEIRVEHDRDIRKSPQESQMQAVGGAAAALIPYRSPAAKFSRNILISRDFGRIPYQTEPHISINPKDPDHILAALID